MSLTSDQKFACEYHMNEMTLRRDRQWKAFAWAVSLQVTLSTATIFAFKTFNLGFYESVVIAIVQLLITVFAFEQILHDRRVMRVHWKAARKLHKNVPELAIFSDRDAKSLDRIRPLFFLCVIAVFSIAVIISLGLGILERIETVKPETAA